MATSRTAVVVGGGIGGLAAAVGLVRGGWRVTVLERAPHIRPVGAGVALAPNAVRALDWLGLGDELRARGTPQGPAGVRTAAGRWLIRAQVEDLRRLGPPTYVLHRADLHRMLTAVLGGADLRTGHHVTGARQDAGGVTVGYDGPDGPGTATAGLVIAADGLHSRLRTSLFPGHPGPAYAGYVAWRGIVPAGAPVRALPGIPAEPALTETWGPGHRFGVAPLAGGGIYWYATRTAPRGAHSGDGIGDLAARFAGWHPPIPQVLAATPPQGLLRHDICHLRAPLPAYVAGRIALLGDAAHAMTPDLGQGACQALEDAVTLAVLAAGDGDVPAALAAYDRARRPRAQRLVRASARTGRIAQWRNPAAVAARDTLARLVPAGAYVRSIGRTVAWTPPPG